MRERRHWTVHDLRRDNRSVLLSSLFFGPASSRQELNAATGLSPASVSNVVRDLIDEGIVVEAGSAGTSLPAAGRRPARSGKSAGCCARVGELRGRRDRSG